MAFKSILAYGKTVLDDPEACELWAKRVGFETGKISTPVAYMVYLPDVWLQLYDA